jgi:NAD(P)-dependent dehydrogenase (short-subunit alcohol dehydrogenase family)
MAKQEPKVAVVTGAGRGIGRALVDELRRRDYTVVAVVRTIADVEELSQLEPGRLFAVRADVTEPSTEVVLREFLQRQFSKVDVLINNAGFGATAYGIEALKYEELEATLAVHCYGPIRVVKATLPLLRAAKDATIVNMSSRFGSLEWVSTRVVPAKEATYAYRIAKAALNMLTSCLAVELEEENINVISLDPGKVKTRFGPKDADIEPQDAAQAILDVIEKRSQTATFVHAVSGDKVPW